MKHAATIGEAEGESRPLIPSMKFAAKLYAAGPERILRAFLRAVDKSNVVFLDGQVGEVRVFATPDELCRHVGTGPGSPHDANLSNADLTNTNLSGAKITKGQLAQAIR